MSPLRSNPLSCAAKIAGEQHRAATFAQLRGCGFSPSMIKTAAAAGVLTAVHHEVYLLGPPPSSPFERAHAAVLAGRPTGLMSHEWCRWLFGLGPLPDHDPDVTTTTKRRTKGVRWHLTTIAPEADANHGIPCTRPERMLIDLAPTLTFSALRRLFNDVQIHSLTDLDRIREALDTHPGRTTRTLTELAADDRGVTRSLLEDLVDDLLLQHQPERNATVHGYEVDFFFPGLHLVLEADGWNSHRTKAQFDADRARRLDLEARGTRVIAVSYAMVTKDRDRTRASLAAIIGG